MRVLLVEDAEDDALIVLRMLRTGGFQPEHQRVETPEAMTAALGGGSWDVVISDYTMPKFSGLAALALLQKSGLDTPFIVVTGTIGEEEAVRCLHAGAADYLLKDRLERLPSAVQRALAAAEEHRRRLQAEQKLAANERRLRTIIETEPECVHLLASDCTLLEINSAGLRMVEADSLEQVIGGSALDLVLPEYRAAYAEMVERVLRGESAALEFEIQGMKGRRRWLEMQAVPMRDEQGRVTSLLGVSRDATERKQTEKKLQESERFLHSLNEASPHWIYVFDFDVMGVTYLNRSILRSLNHSEAESEDNRLESFRAFMAAGEMPHLARLLEEWQALPDGQCRDDEYHLRHADGSTHSFAGREVVFARRPDGTVLQILGTLADITKQKQAEERFRELFEHSPDAIFVESHQGTVLDVNLAGCQLHGLTREQLVGRNVLDLVPPSERESVARGFSKLAAGELQNVEGFSWTATGRAVPVEITSNQIVFSRQPALLLHVRDITERKWVADALDRERNLLRTMIDLLPDYIYIKDQQSRFLLANSSVAQAMGVAGPEILIGKSDTDFYPPKVSAVFRSDEQEVLAGREMFNKEETVLLPDGSRRFLLTTKVPLKDAAGKIIGLVGIGRDFTVRKQAEEAVQTSQRMLQLVLDNIPQGVFWKDRDSRYLGCNATITRHRGVENAEALIGKTDREFASLPPEQAESFIRKDLEVMASDLPQLGIIEQTTRADGSTRWVETNKVPFHDTAGNVIGVLGTWQDITERKQAEEAVQTSQRMLQLVLDNIPQGVFWKDRQSRYLGCNTTVVRSCGVENAEALIGKTDREFAVLPPEQAEFFIRTDQEVMASGQRRLGIIEQTTRGDGSVRWLETNKVPLHDSAGNVIGVLGTWQDITERTQAGEEQKLFRALIEHAADFIEVIDPETGRFLDLNDRGCMNLGYTREEMLQMGVPDINPKVDLPTFRQIVGSLRTVETLNFESVHRRKNGTTYPVEVAARLVRLNREYLVASVRDITARKLAEAAVQTSQRMLQLILDNIPQGVFWKDRESRYLGCNAVFARTFGIEKAESVTGRSDRDLASMTPGQAEFFVRKDREVMDLGQPQMGIVEQATFPDGSTRWLETNKVPLHDVAGNVIGVLGTSQDITARKQAEAALKLSEFSVQHASLPTFWIARDARILRVNRAACDLLGYTEAELLALAITDLDPDFPVERWPSHWEELRARGRMCFETRQRHKDGRIIPIEADLNWFEFDGREYNFAFVRDLTERQKQERLAHRSQRMESIGTLAGGIAHDLNNALAPIVMSSELLRMHYPGESRMLDTVEASARRAADMVRQLLSFAKGAEGARISVQPGRLVKELENLMKGSFPKNIRVVVHCDPNLPMVVGDATQLHQVLLNLCVNARDAMPNGGTLTLEATSKEVDALYAISVLDAKPGKFVALGVRDTGTGIPPEIIDRIFDPFFTTKDPDKGTGLGLSTCLGIVKGHGGFIQVSSQPGHGATFTAFLPVSPAGADPELVSKAAGDFRGHGETILFVDDEAEVRNVAREVLRDLNFEPVTAIDGADALIRAAQHRTEIRAIITDLHMPRMDGLAFARQVRRLLPDIPIVVASGYMDDDVAEKFKTLGVTNRLDKPFTEIQLAVALKNVLATK